MKSSQNLHRVFGGLGLLAAGPILAASWSQYRGPQASGVDDRVALPTAWNVETGENVRWQTPIPGLSHASLVAWGDRIFVISAEAKSKPKAELKVGLYGDIESADDRGPQEWRLRALDSRTGKEVWQTLAHAGIPKVSRHTKASHANSTPATDGQRIVALLGSEGLFCFDTAGALQWKKDLGPMDSGYYAAPSAQWGFGSSPVIHDGKVVVNCDVQKGSYLTVLDLRDGHEIWRTARTDVPTWGTPAVIEAAGRIQIVVNGWHETAGYDFATGRQFWKLDGGGDIPVPTPVFSRGLIYLTSAHGKWRPLRAIRPEATGDITPADPGKTNAAIVWAHGRQGSYMQTPIVVGNRLFACNDLGILTCVDASTGVVEYSERLSRAGHGFTASPVSDGRNLYFPSEMGNVYVVPVTGAFAVLAINPLPEVCMTAPAIVDGMLIFRTRDRVLAVAAGAKSAGIGRSSETASAQEPSRVVLQAPPRKLLGEWEGTLVVGPNKLRLAMQFRESDGKFTGLVTSLDQGNQKLSVTRLGEMTTGEVRLEIDGIAATFVGKWSPDGEGLAGEWQQYGDPLPLVLTRKKP